MSEDTRVLRLAVPRNDQEAADVPGLATSVAFALGVMARSDGTMTVDEYQALTHGAESLAETSDNPALLRVATLRGVVSEQSLTEALAVVASHIGEETPQEVKEAAFASTVPLLDCQYDQREECTKKWAEALSLSDSTLDSMVSTVSGSFSQGFSSIASLWSRTEEESQADRVKHIAKVFQDDDLLEAAEEADDDDDLEGPVESAKQRALTRAVDRLPVEADLQVRIDAASKFEQLVRALVEQLEQRLVSVSHRTALQSDLFGEDVEAFIDSVTDEVQLRMHKMVAGKNTDWTDEELWEEFSQGESADIARERFKKLKGRYDRFIDLWNQEIAAFSKEMVKTVKFVFETVPEDVFAGLIDTDLESERYANLLDRVTSTVAATAVVGGGALLATGAAGIALGGIAMPVGIVLGLAIGGALLYKHLSDVETRKQETVEEKAAGFRERLTEVLGDPIPEFDSRLKEVEDKFVGEANRYFVPLVRDIRLLILQARLQQEAVRGVLFDTTMAFRLTDGDEAPESCRLPEPHGSPRAAVSVEKRGKAYFFRGGSFLRFALDGSRIDSPRRSTGIAWPGVGSEGVDAALYWDEETVFFFRGDEYVRFNLVSDRMDSGYPMPISKGWPGLWSDGIDAALNAGDGNVYFFKGSEYVRYDVDEDEVADGYPMDISHGWSGVWSDGIDAAVNWCDGDVYFFKGDEYLRWLIEDDEVADGYPMDIAGNWAGLA